jgi:hypothetical protein
LEPEELIEKYAGSLVVMVTPEKDYSLDQEGLGYNTRPLLPLSNKEKEEIKSVLKKVGLLTY